MDDWVILGLFAGLLTTAGFIPQIMKGIQTKHLGDISLVMPVILSLGMFLWLIYGVVKNDVPIILWNAISIGLNLILIFLIIKYRRHDGREKL